MASEIRLPKVLALGNLGEAKLLLLAALTEDQDVHIDAGALEQVDAAGAQLLLVFCRDARALGKAIAWRGVTSPLQKVATTLGMKTLGLGS